MSETHHLVFHLRDDDTVADDHEALEPRCNGAGLGLVAQLAEQGGDRSPVVRPRIANRQIHGGRLVACWARP